jgi:uncharacterized coiled-coil protein SlyX
VQRVPDLETANSQQQTSIASLQQQLASSQQQVQDLSSQLAAWQARGSRAEQQLSEVQQQLVVSTPRPKRELGLLTDLLTAGETQLVEQALIAGEQCVLCHRWTLARSSNPLALICLSRSCSVRHVHCKKGAPWWVGKLIYRGETDLCS